MRPMMITEGIVNFKAQMEAIKPEEKGIIKLTIENVIIFFIRFNFYDCS